MKKIIYLMITVCLPIVAAVAGATTWREDTREIIDTAVVVVEPKEKTTVAAVEPVEPEPVQDSCIHDLIAWVVYGEVGRCGDDDEALYLTACVILNRAKMFDMSVEEVIYADGQWAVDYYNYLSANGYYPDERCYAAAGRALTENNTPSGLIYCDSLETRDGLYYESRCGQKFYVVED